MLKFLKLISFSILVFSPVLGFSQNDKMKKDRMASDLDFIKSTFEVNYAPAEWKKKYAGWDLHTEIATAKQKILALEKVESKYFQSIVKDFFKSASDYHVGVIFFSTETATLPFRIKGSNGRYFFSHIDRNRLSPVVFPINVGDELISFGGRPTHEVIEELKKKELGNGNEPTDRALAEMFLTMRLGAYGHDVPKGPIVIKVNKQGSLKPSSYQLIWDYAPEKVTSAFQAQPMAAAKNQKQDSVLDLKTLKNNPIFQKKLITPLFEKISALCEDEDEIETLGSRKSFIPALGNIEWKTSKDSIFHAYLYRTEDSKVIGYVRIPNYLGSEEEVEEFSAIIKVFQEQSDALVIDQVNNPGGSVFYLYALLSKLTEDPLFTPKHRMMITPEDVFTAVTVIPVFEQVNSDDDAQELLGETYEGIPVTYQMAQFFLNYFRFIEEEWNAGRTFTSPYFLYGIDSINPDPHVRYTKPILLLVNEMDFSGGDFLPAILQDNKRVTILGTRTAGAGGYVAGTAFPNLYGIAYFHYTASLAERADSNPIENLGVTPDIPYEITEEDIQHNYRGYVQAINEAVRALLP